MSTSGSTIWQNFWTAIDNGAKTPLLLWDERCANEMRSKLQKECERFAQQVPALGKVSNSPLSLSGHRG
jgi:hypothetical protein